MLWRTYNWEKKFKIIFFNFFCHINVQLPQFYCMLEFLGEFSVFIRDILPLMVKSRIGSTSDWYKLQSKQNKKKKKQLGEIKLSVSLPNDKVVLLGKEMGLSIEEAPKAKSFKIIDNVPETIFANFTPEERQRQQILYEFIETESNYVNDLSLVIDSIIDPLVNQNIIQQVDVEQIFINIPELYEINSAFLAALGVCSKLLCHL